MKALIFAMIVLLGIDLGVYHGTHLHHLRDGMIEFGDSIGAWVFAPG